MPARCSLSTYIFCLESRRFTRLNVLHFHIFLSIILASSNPQRSRPASYFGHRLPVSLNKRFPSRKSACFEGVINHSNDLKHEWVIHRAVLVSFVCEPQFWGQLHPRLLQSEFVCAQSNIENSKMNFLSKRHGVTLESYYISQTYPLGRSGKCLDPVCISEFSVNL